MADKAPPPSPTNEEPYPPPPEADDDTYPEKPETSSDEDSDAEQSRPDESDIDEDDNSPEANFKRFARVLDSERYKRAVEEEEDEIVYHEDRYDFPEDPEDWREEDLKELWADGPIGMDKPGWDPNWVDKKEVEVINKELREGRDPPIAPFYVPYRKYFPVIPDNNYDVNSPKTVIEELDRIEEFLVWHSFIFQDGSTYEGTVWDDLAHGKGVYEAEQGLVRYEGEWLQNNPEGHGVLEVDLPTYEPVPGSKLEAEMRAEGRIFKRDFMSPEDREWLEMDIEDSIRLSGGQREIPFYENEEWVRQFGEKPEKGRYRYAGQWKHGRMHGCGVFELNDRVTYGRFYFGEFMDEHHGCDVDASALHSGIAEVAAAKARMFVNKPDGMVREERGPYSDPQHPYLYEDEDMWMAPGFINQFCEVPDYWKAYMEDVDAERQMWINSFYRSPLRIPMPAELEYWWETEEPPEFVLLNKEPEPDPEDPSKMVYTEDPVILHTPTGRLINYVDDEEHGVRLFWQPPLEEGEDVDPSKAEFLPLGFDEFFGRQTGAKQGFIWRTLASLENICKPIFEKLENWIEKKKKDGEMKLKLIETELDLVEAETELKKVIKDMDEELKKLEKEEEKKMEKMLKEEKNASRSEEQTDKYREISHDEDEIEDEDEDEGEGDDEDDDNAPPSFGSIVKDQDSTGNNQKGIGGGKSSPFAASSLPIASCGVTSLVPSPLQQSFAAWKESNLRKKTCLPCSSPSTSSNIPANQHARKGSVAFPRKVDQGLTLQAARQTHQQQGNKPITKSLFRNSFKHKASANLQRNMGEQKRQNSTWAYIDPSEELNVLSLHILL